MTKARQTEVPLAPLPLFYRDPVLIRFEEHRDMGLLAEAGFGFANEAIAIPLCTSEFAIAMRHYPIVFAQDELAMPLAIVGLKEGHNLFLERDGSWRAGSYVPAYVRRYPFIVMEPPDKTQQLLALDRASNRVVTRATAHAGAQPLFDSEGKPTSFTQSAMAFCHAYHADFLATAAFSQALLAAKILAPSNAEMQFPDGTRHALNGFRVIDEPALRNLPPRTVKSWHVNGWLDLVALQLASRLNWQALLELGGRRKAGRKALM
ncbi:SapC family protein [Phreatobacter sp. AB_2022a]|uniref:SapC family protein n=1 Tax=Phreatobacter sp. AB_2022a TaxID=3003134 RepID=UPI0022870566|nr:SapC family protein [Phreatobacter sp. AB_2022a]MCZ0733273.1 SapC family protein [Phreatobacter sp. AB_2022a]